MSSEKTKVFTRDATGLVREVSPIDSFGIAVTGVGMISIFLFFSYYMSAAPNDNPLLSVVLMIVPLVALAAVWAYLMAVFPRSGGDYVFNTRSLHPTIGIMTDFLYVSILPSVLSLFIILALQVFADMFTIEGFLTSNPGLTALGTSLSDPGTQFAACTVLAIVTAFFLIGRTKLYTRFQAIFVVAGIIVVFLLVGALAVTPNSTYQVLLQQVFQVDYSSTIQKASGQGFTSPAFTGASLFGTSFLIFWLAGPQYGAFVAGETKRPQRTALIAIVGGQIVMIVLFLLVGAASYSTFGLDFSYAVNFLAGKGANPLPTGQVTFLDLAVPIMANPVIVAIVFTIIGVGAYLVGSNACLGASRKIFAWSFDRLLPAKFCDVSPRFKTPVHAAILVSIIAEIFNYLIIYNVGVYNIITGFGVVYSAVIWGVSALSAVVLPTKKELFDQAPSYVRKKVGGVPVLSIIGAIAFVTIVGLLIFGQLVPTIQGGLDPRATTWTFGIFFGGLVYYYLAKWYRMKRGIDLSLVYKQIPPE